MTRKVTIIVQAILTLAQTLNAGHIFPPNWEGTIAVVITGVQAAWAIVAHNWNPDGTNAEVGYVKK